MRMGVMTPFVCMGVVLAGGVFLQASIVRAASDSAHRVPTIQQRFASKSGAYYIHATTVTHVRNDFYSSFGGGVDLGLYPSENIGLELRLVGLRTRLNRSARRVQRETALVPDARPQSLWLAVGGRYSVGYGKILFFESKVVHFDPQLTAHIGVARAEKRWLPSAWFGMSLLAHFRYGLQARLDLAMTVQAEKRRRGWIPSAGLAPMLSIGWTPGVFLSGGSP